MALKTVCPACDTAYMLADDKLGKKVRCKKCEEVFVAKEAVEEEQEKERPARNGIQKKSAGPTGEDVTPSPRRRRSAAEEEDEVPRRARSRRDEDEDEDEDRPRRSRRDEEDDEDRPSRRRKSIRKQGGPSTGLILGLVGAGLAVLVAVGVVVVLLARDPDTAAPNAAGGPGQPGDKPGDKGAPGLLPVALQVELPWKEGQIKDIQFARTANQAGLLVEDISGPRVVRRFETYDLKTRKRVAGFEVPGLLAPKLISLSPDAATVVVQNADAGNGDPLTVYSLPGGNAVLSKWVPYPKPDNPGLVFPQELLWLECLGKDRVLTVKRNGSYNVWSLPGGKKVYHVEGNLPGTAYLSVNAFSRQPMNIALSPDRSTLALFNGDGFDLIEPASGRFLRKTVGLADLGGVGNAWGAGFSPDGSKLAFHFMPRGSRQDAKLVWWDVASGQRKGAHGFRWNVSFSCGVRWWGNKHVVLWNGILTEGVVADAKTCRWLCHCQRAGFGRYAAGGPGGRLWFANARIPGGNAFLSAQDVPTELAALKGKADPANLPVWKFTPDGVEK
jgi:predicted Zn finger-like uncharacterized protein